MIYSTLRILFHGTLIPSRPMTRIPMMVWLCRFCLPQPRQPILKWRRGTWKDTNVKRLACCWWFFLLNFFVTFILEQPMVGETVEVLMLSSLSDTSFYSDLIRNALLGGKASHLFSESERFLYFGERKRYKSRKSKERLQLKRTFNLHVTRTFRLRLLTTYLAYLSQKTFPPPTE